MTVLNPPSQELRSNMRHLYLDIIWVGVVSGSTLSFMGIFAARLGASSLQMGLLGSGPALINLLVSLPTGRWLEDRHLVKAAFWGAFVARLGFVAMIFLPWLFSKPDQIWGTIWITLMMAIPATVLNISFNSLFAGVVPPEWRSTVVGRRNALVAAVTTAVVYLSGQILDRVVFPLNYQLVFTIGAVGALVSCYHIYQIRLPGETTRQGILSPRILSWTPRTIQWSGIVRWLRNFRPLLFTRRDRSSHSDYTPLLRLDVLRGPFGTFMVAYLLFYLFQYVPGALFALYNVHDLNLTDGEIGIGNALLYIFMTIVSLGLNRISLRLGHRKTLVFGSLVFWGYPFLLYLAHGPVMFWVASAFAGAVWALIGGGLVNRLMERVPENDRPAHMAWHNLVFNLGVMAGTMLGPIGSDWLGLRNMMLVSAVLRLLGGLILLMWG
jgi:Na+/melibiose symporter-like transporter